MLVFAVASLVLLSTPAISYFALGSLEWRYPPANDRPASTPAIVILGGYLRPPDAAQPWPELGYDSLARCLRGVELYHAGPSCPIVVSGGAVAGNADLTIADSMADLLIAMGVERDDILIENRSSSTHENAINTAQLLRELGIDRVVRVTDATHLLRSELCFLRQGIDTVPRGTRYRATSLARGISSFIPSAGAIGGIDDAAHEWLGLAWYWARGWIGEGTNRQGPLATATRQTVDD